MGRAMLHIVCCAFFRERAFLLLIFLLHESCVVGLNIIFSICHVSKWWEAFWMAFRKLGSEQHKKGALGKAAHPCMKYLYK